MNYTPELIEFQHVHSVYEDIAAHFSSTRHGMWPNVKSYLNQLPIGSIILDAGSGNGKYLSATQDKYMIGADRSVALASICGARELECLVSDNLYLAIRDSSIDTVLSIAVIHHFASEERRLIALKECARVLRWGGSMLVYVWAFEQTGRFKDVFETQEAFVPWYLPNRFKCSNQKIDAPFVAEKNGSKYLRYYHLFRQGELEQLLGCISCLSIVDHGFDQENWWCSCIKK